MDLLLGFILGFTVCSVFWVLGDIYAIVKGACAVADVEVLMNDLIALRTQYTLGLAPATPSWELRLFANNRTPDSADSAGVYTPCTLAGYAPVALVPGDWVGAISGGVDTQNYPPVVFTFSSGGQTIYGHYIYNLSAGLMGWACLWETPFVVPGGGGSVEVALQWADKQC